MKENAKVHQGAFIETLVPCTMYDSSDSANEVLDIEVEDDVSHEDIDLRFRSIVKLRVMWQGRERWSHAVPAQQGSGVRDKTL